MSSLPFGDTKSIFFLIFLILVINGENVRFIKCYKWVQSDLPTILFTAGIVKCIEAIGTPLRRRWNANNVLLKCSKNRHKEKVQFYMRFVLRYKFMQRAMVLNWWVGNEMPCQASRSTLGGFHLTEACKFFMLRIITHDWYSTVLSKKEGHFT